MTCRKNIILDRNRKRKLLENNAVLGTIAERMLKELLHRDFEPGDIVELMKLPQRQAIPEPVEQCHCDRSESFFKTRYWRNNGSHIHWTQFANEAAFCIGVETTP